MKTIYKYELRIDDFQTVIMPEGAVLLHAGNQNGKACLWAEVDTSRFQQVRKFAIVGTGNPIPEVEAKHRLQFISTVIADPFVWHVYEVLAVEKETIRRSRFPTH